MSPALVDEPLPTASCLGCRRPRSFYTLDLPLGLGRGTYLADCLCEIERREAEARRAKTERLLAQAGIPDRHRAATFDTFDVTPASARIVEVCRGFVAGFPDRGRGLTLAGPPGTGKTHLAVALTHALIARGVGAVFVNVPQLFWRFRASLGQEAGRAFDDLLDRVTRCEHLVLDDLGRERLTPWVQETLYLVLNTRYESCRATSLTTNHLPDGLRARIGAALADRLAETNDAYGCQWPSYRRAQRPAEEERA